MAATTNIAWADSTFNPWVGCTKIAPGCDHCYAAEMAARFSGLYGERAWDGEHYQRVESAWTEPKKLNRKAAKEGRRIRVFSGSMCDVFDNKANPAARGRLWDTIRVTPHLYWLLLTKRAPNIEKYLPADWGDGYPNVWLGVTCEDRQHGYPRLDILRQIPAMIRFVSAEPLIEDIGDADLTGIDWLIVGGESGRGFRPMNPDWARVLRDRCQREGVAFFYKQDGGLGGGGHLLDGVRHYDWPAPHLVSEAA